MKVECYAGYRGEETPRRFYLGKRCVEVVDVLDRWLDPAHRYFKLRGDDNGIYILRHSTSEDTCEYYERGLVAPGVDYDTPEPYLKAICDPLDIEGYVHVPQEPGMGYQINWDYIEDNKYK